MGSNSLKKKKKEKFPTNYSLTNLTYNIYMYKQDLALNNHEGLIRH